jgi:glycosyltransferase involved in cell wall biosynthesis
MKIAMIFFDISIPAGGQRQFLSLAKELTRRGHLIKIYTCKQDRSIFPNLWDNLDVTLVDTINYNKSIWQKILFFNKDYYDYINKTISIFNKMDKDFDVINCHEDFAYRIGYYYKKIKPNTKIVWSLNNVSYFYSPIGNKIKVLKSYLLNIYKNHREKKYYKAVNVVTPLSRYEAKWSLDRKLKTMIVRSGLDFDSFYKPIKIIKKGMRITLLSVGAMGAHRRFEDTISSVKILCDQGFDIDAKIVCKKISGFDSNEYETYLREYINKLDLNSKITLLTNGVSEHELIEIYSHCHIFIHPLYLPPPQYYGWGLVVFESIAAGLPVVLCNITGATEVLTDKKNAIFATPLNGESFADGIKSLIINPEYYNQIAKNGQDFVKNNISWSKYTDSMIKAFTE